MGGDALILLDTHVWIWLNSDNSRLGPQVVSKIESGEEELAISAISIWEAIMAFQKGRLSSADDPVRTVESFLASNPVRVLHVDRETAFLSRSLLFSHDDPADRFIAATAYRHSIPLATNDKQLLKLHWLQTIPN